MKKRILFINGHLNTGGVEKSLMDILRHLDFEKFEIELLLLEDFGDYINEIPKHVKVRLFDMHNTYGSVFQCLKNCIKDRDWKCLWVRIVFLISKFWGKEKYKYIRKTIFGNKEYDCVIGFRPGIASELAAYSVKCKKRVTWWHHGEFNMNVQQAKDYYGVCSKMDQIVVVSKGCENFFQSHYPEGVEKMIVIPNMLDIETIYKKADEYVPFAKKNGILYFVSVGRLSPEKHFENIIYVAKNIADMGTFDCRWFIVGAGNEKSTLEKLIVENDLTNKIFLVGSKSNPYPYMKNADCIVHTSYVESQCLAVLEAMALGKICIVTESVGPKEFAANGNNCILVEQNKDSLRRGVELFVTKHLDNCNMKIAAMNTAKEYRTDKIIAKIEEILF